jgi:hypothetical protein
VPTPTQGTAAVVSLVASHVKSAFPKTSFEVYSHHADLIHVAWRGTPQTDEVRSYLQTLRLQRQIPNVDFNFHHTDPEKPSRSPASAGKDHVGDCISDLEQSLKSWAISLARLQEDVDKIIQAGVEDLQVLARKLEPSVAEARRLLDAELEKCGQLKKADVPQTRALLHAELVQIANQRAPVMASIQSVQKELGEWINAHVNVVKDDAVRVLRQLDYSAAEARKAVDAAWEKYGPMETAAEVVRKVFEKRPPRPEADPTSG